MTPANFDEVLSVSTDCECRATDGDGAPIAGSESPSWALSDVGKSSGRWRRLESFGICHLPN